MANTYDRGDLVKVEGTFTNAAGAAIDPAVVRCQYRAPDGTVTELLYNTDPELVREGPGVYHVEIDANQSGTWYYRFYSTGSGQAASEGFFVVGPSYF